MTKNPAFVLPLVTLYIFTFGYVYEWGYLSEFDVEGEVVNHSYPEFLVLSTHALTVALRNSNAIIVIFLTSTIIAIVYSISRLTAYQAWVVKRKKREKEFSGFLVSIVIISLLPFSLLIIFLAPGLLGYYEAVSLKESSVTHWQEIELLGNPPTKMEGVTIRLIGERIIFYQKMTQ